MSNIFTKLLLNTDKFDQGLFKAQKNLKGFAATSKGVFGGLTMFTSYAAAFVGISTSIHSAVTANMEFEKSLSSLRSLTGVSAEELNYFRTEAIRMGMDSTQSASQMVDAFKLIGSQMPELLKNKTALTQTAEAAVVLAEAAELDVPTAAKALTGSLNQMGASSAEATDYINMLAAASQKGSADIPYLNRAIENAGGAASSVGIKFNELVASIEAIAPRITNAGSAGTNLRNIFLTLESSADNNLKPSVVGLSKSLENLAAKNLDATQLTKMFGKESVTAAIAILQERDAFEELRIGIVGTNTAYDQAAINNDNLAGSIGKLQSAWTSFINTLSGSNGIISGLVDELRNLIVWANKGMMTAEELKEYNQASEKKIEVQESNRRIQGYVNSGMTMEQALDKELENANRMYPEAGLVFAYKKRLEDAKKELDDASIIKMFSGQADKDLSNYYAAEEALKSAEREFDMRNAIYKNIEQQKKALEEVAKKQEEVNKGVVSGVETTNISPEGSIANIDSQLTELRKQYSEAVTTEARVAVQKTIDELEARKIFLKVQVETEIFQEGRTGPDSIVGDGSSLTDLVPKMELPKIEIPSLKKNIKENEEYAKSLGDINTVILSMSNIMSNNADNMGQWALQSLGSISQMIIQLQALATAQGVASASSVPFPGSLAAIATVVSTIMGIFSSLPKFAEGGIVSGGSYFGDRLLVRVNSGEMILNQTQQRNLYNLVESPRENISINIDKVRGADIYMSLSNYMKQTGKKL